MMATNNGEAVKKLLSKAVVAEEVLGQPNRGLVILFTICCVFVPINAILILGGEQVSEFFEDFPSSSTASWIYGIFPEDVALRVVGLLAIAMTGLFIYSYTTRFFRLPDWRATALCIWLTISCLPVLSTLIPLVSAFSLICVALLVVVLVLGVAIRFIWMVFSRNSTSKK